LNLSYNFGIPDFEITDNHVQASLSFQGRRYCCVLPFNAVFAFTSHAQPVGYVWPESTPEELAAHFGQLPAAPAPLPPPPVAASRFRVIEGEGGAEETTP